eukprot:15480476-Alexandrium_andersonii.AAC.1
MGVSDFRRFEAAERALRPVRRAGTAAPSGWIMGPELTLTRRLSDRLGVPTYEKQSGGPVSNIDLCVVLSIFPTS